MRDRSGTHKVLVVRPDGKRTLGKSKCRWEDNIKIVLQEGGWGHGLNLSGSR